MRVRISDLTFPSRVSGKDTLFCGGDKKEEVTENVNIKKQEGQIMSS